MVNAVSPTNRPHTLLGWLRLAALASALAAILFMATGVEYWHSHAPGSDEATCPICHVAHMPILRGVPTRALAAPTAVAWVVPSETQVSHSAPSSFIPPPRAPPA